MAKLINYLVVCVGLVALCALVASAKHHEDLDKNDQLCARDQESSPKKHRGSRRHDDDDDEAMDTRPKHHSSKRGHKKSRQGSDPICKELPCQDNVDPSEHICARVKTKNKKGQPTVVTLRSRKCMEWSNKCEPDAHFHFYQLCHDGDCDQPPEDSLDRCY